jgi:hypothetical protein
MRAEIVSMLSNIIDEGVMVSFIRRQSFVGASDLLEYIERLNEPHRLRWIEAYNKASS